jgi:hypothetical protein
MLRRFVFGKKMDYMVENLCLFQESIRILVNGSPTEEVEIKGLNQGDPLHLFLFLSVVEGLRLLVFGAVTLGFFKLTICD